ncbi:MAG: NUDIX hydrolase [Anaerolineae bacterium]|jgi:8-oxo-dGTP pyrophosphatase MutT (NUDIX family)|nr:NUDIX hydrolase [Anaerolineae bacterium]
MLNQIEFTVKAFALILRRLNGEAPAQLLTFAFEGSDVMNFPGGKLDADERLTETLYREIQEETGFDRDQVDLLRKIGVVRYHEGDQRIERHDYLMVLTVDAPDQWTQVITGNGGDHGERIHLRWLTAAECDQISSEQQTFLDAGYLPEWFKRIG